MQYAGVYLEFFNPNHPWPQWLPQVSLSSLTKLHHTASRTMLTQTFINPSTVSSIPSAKYIFPLYESCAIVAFRCYVGKRLIEGIIKEKEDASATYQAAVGRNEPASLLEQHTVDAFSTRIGNIPAGETVKVEIEYIMELKHDAEVDGLRFTIPTSIAPRYGPLPSGLSASGDGVTAKAMNISVQVSMSSSIKSIQSPSHPISLHLGGHSMDTPDDAFNPQHALATLGQTSTELDKDFVLLIKCASLSSPVALLEVHPTIPNSKALMVTLVPKFNLPKSSKPEIVFIVDRSGSMASRIPPLKSSLSVFLKSLPLDVNFNICSFGSQHSFLWDKSRPYSSRSFEEAQKYCDGMKADFGGTEILPAIKSTIERRLKDLNLEIMVLTDGEVWNTADLFEYVEKETKKKNGDVRLFSLGIGRDVSHALIDGLARVGRGFSQVVSDEREGMESKVARMLRGGLSAHVGNYRLEWEGKPSVDVVVKKSSKSSSSRPMIRRHISLFDSSANVDSPVSFSDDSPDFTIPSVIQAPYKIQPLFPFSRSTAYALLLSSSDERPPSHVWLRGTTPEGDELELKIEVQTLLPVPGETIIHQLGARKILQELKDGTSYVHGGVVDDYKERQSGLLAEWVKKEGVRVGLKYGVASQWTSFVAVERKVEVEEEKMEVVEEKRPDQAGGVDGYQSHPSDLSDDEDWDSVIEANRDDDDRMDGLGPPPPAGVSVPVMMMTTPPPPPIPYQSIRRCGTILDKGKSATASKSGMYEGFLKSKTASVLSPPYSGLSGGSVVMPQSATTPAAVMSLLPGRPLPEAPFGSSMSPSPSPLIERGGVRGRDDDDGTGTPPPPPMKLLSFSPSSIMQQQQQQQQSEMMMPLSSSPKLHPYSVMATQQPQSSSRRRSARSGGGASFGSAPPPRSLPFGFSPSVVGTMYEPFLMTNPTGMVPDSVSEDASLLSKTKKKKGDYSFTPLAGPFFRANNNNNNIGISYTPSSGPPPERLSAEGGGGGGQRQQQQQQRAQPLSARTKSLIDLQTFEGSFVLDSALAMVLGVPISTLEAALLTLLPGKNAEHVIFSKVWATVLAIKMFETELVGEKGVWELVVDKARAWIGSLDDGSVVGVEDVVRLEKMAGEVLNGVAAS